MKSMLENDFKNASSRESSYSGEPLSVVGICLDDETWRFLNLFAGLTPSIRVRSRVASYRSDQDQDAILEQLGEPAPDICLLDFDTNRRAAVMMGERLHVRLLGV